MTGRARPRRTATGAGLGHQAIEVASALIREIGFESVVIGGLEMGRHLMPRTPLSGERSPEEIRKIAATLTP
jgi:hypothetical protein